MEVLLGPLPDGRRSIWDESLGSEANNAEGALSQLIAATLRRLTELWMIITMATMLRLPMTDCFHVLAACSPVYTPHSGYFWWTAAKMYFNNADGLVSQIVHHLVNAHLVSETFAAATFRHLVEDHPVHQLLAPHFKGLVNINTVGFEKLTSPNGAITRVAGFGHSGLLDLIKFAYEDWHYDNMSFTGDLTVSFEFSKWVFKGKIFNSFFWFLHAL